MTDHDPGMGARLDVDAVVRDWASRGSQLDEPSRRAVVAILDNELNRPSEQARPWTDALYAFNPELVVSVDEGRLLRSVVRSHLAFGQSAADATVLHDRIGVLVDDLVVGAARRVTEPVVVPVAAAAEIPAAEPATVAAPARKSRARKTPAARSVAMPRRRSLTQLSGILAALAGIALIAAVAPLTPIMSNAGDHKEKEPAGALPFASPTTTTSAPRPSPVPRATTTTIPPTTDTIVSSARPGSPRARRGATTTLPLTAPVTSVPTTIPSTTPITTPPPPTTTTTVPIFIGPIVGPVTGPITQPIPPTSTTPMITPAIPQPTTTTTTTPLPTPHVTTPPTPSTTIPPVAASGSSHCPHEDDPPPGWDNDSGRQRRPPHSCGRPLGTASRPHGRRGLA